MTRKGDKTMKITGTVTGDNGNYLTIRTDKNPVVGIMTLYARRDLGLAIGDKVSMSYTGGTSAPVYFKVEKGGN